MGVLVQSPMSMVTQSLGGMGQISLLLLFEMMSSKRAHTLRIRLLLTVQRVHRMILDDLGVRQIAAVVGGSMGGMLTLEYAYFGKDYVRTIVPIATSSRHSAWGISWGEQQRQSIYADPKYADGYYTFEDPPSSGLGAARMSALLTYRSRNSFETRFGRNVPDASRHQGINGTPHPVTPHDDHWAVHNDGYKYARSSRPLSRRTSPPPKPPPARDETPDNNTHSSTKDTDAQKTLFTDPQFHGTTTFVVPEPPTPLTERKRATTYFSAQSYLRYQGEKFVKRFDSNCYIAITRKLDTHDVSRDRVPPGTEENPVQFALSQIEQPTLVLGIESDGLFTFAEQQEIAVGIPNARLKTIDSPEGHDAFLLQFEQVNRYILDFFTEVLPDIVQRPGIAQDGETAHKAVEDGAGKMMKTSTFGEAEVGDFTAW